MNRTGTLRDGSRHSLEPNGMVFMLPTLIIYTFVVGLPSIMTVGVCFYRLANRWHGGLYRT